VLQILMCDIARVSMCFRYQRDVLLLYLRRRRFRYFVFRTGASNDDPNPVVDLSAVSESDGEGSGVPGTETVSSDTELSPAAPSSDQSEPALSNSSPAAQPSLCADVNDDVGVLWRFDDPNAGMRAGTVAGAHGKWGKEPATLNAQEKYKLLQHHNRPDRKFAFVPRAVGQKKLSFQCNWLDQYPWLGFSASCNAGFRLPCTLFGSSANKFGHQLGQLYANPMVSFGRASALLKLHSEQEAHQDAMAKAAAFKTSQTTAAPDPVEQLRDRQSVQADENMAKLTAILECIILCGRQNIALRGHRNESWRPGTETFPDSNPGNSLALLHFRHQSGDPSVSRPFHRSGSGGTLPTNTSPQIQNDLITCCGDVIRDSLLKEVREAPAFSVLADEAVDCSDKEQMPIVVRFVDSSFIIREVFLGFAECDEGTTGRALADKVLSFLRSCNLDLSRLRGQGYDGAALQCSLPESLRHTDVQGHSCAQHVDCAVGSQHVLLWLAEASV